jgi:hypothetical protein
MTAIANYRFERVIWRRYYPCYESRLQDRTNRRSSRSEKSLQIYFRFPVIRIAQARSSPKGLWKLAEGFALAHRECHTDVMSYLRKTIRQRIAFHAVLVLLAFFCSATLLHAQAARNHLVNSTILVIRHAEKPAAGASLTPSGFARAQKYAHYFHPFVLNGVALSVNALYAGSDEPNSIRPRLTLEPLSQATGIPLNTHYSTGDSEALARALVEEAHGDHVLIAWRHKKIPALLKALHAAPNRLLPNGVWPDSVYDWVIFLHFDAAGNLDQQRLIHEPDPLP